MLANLTVQDIVLIDRLGIEFDAGLTVLTGETGAGKSILLDALSLALGARGDAALVRAGAERGQVTAVFEPPADHPAFAAARRERHRGGRRGDPPAHADAPTARPRAFINDQPCGVALLREIGAMLVEIHGQHDDRALVGGGGAPAPARRFRPAGSRTRRRWPPAIARLQRAGGGGGAGCGPRWKRRSATPTICAPRWRSWRRLRRSRARRRALAERRQFLMRAEKIAGDLNEAHELVGGNASPVPELVGLARRLERKAARHAGLLDDTARGARTRRSTIWRRRGAGWRRRSAHCDFDPGELERTEERLFALRAAARKYQVAGRRPARRSRPSSPRGSPRSTSAARGCARWRRRRRRRAPLRRRGRGDAVGAARRGGRGAGGGGQCRAAGAEAGGGALHRGARRSTTARSRPTASTAIAFHVRTNPGTEPGPLMKVASGGELSRFLLALKVALADRGSAPTLVFDEIDSGAGGAVAEAIGRRLARLAERVQVLSVTHAPQVAAHAGAHFLISKAEVDRRQAGRDRRSSRSSARRGARRSPACSPARPSPTRRARPRSG